MFIPIFSDVVFLRNTKKNWKWKIILKKIIFFHLVAFIFVIGNSCDLALVFLERTLVS